MQLGVMNLTHHMPNVESICSSTVKAILDLECALILVFTETEHTILLIDKYWLQAAFLVMSAGETTVRQLQCERDEETLVTTSFIAKKKTKRKEKQDYAPLGACPSAPAPWRQPLGV